ncbi:MAG: DegV family protein [Clostridiales bacterium]|nr:DegV family protein [Clostridiales bacterium]
MSYKIVVDSCCDLTPEKKADPHFQFVPLTLEVNGRSFIDDADFDQIEFLQAVAASPVCSRSACPSPEAYLRAYETGDADMVFGITISEHLSGSYSSAVLGRNLYEEEHGQDSAAKRIHIFSSDSACCGEGLIALKIQELAEQGESFESIVEKVEEFIHGMHTYFVLEDMETLRKNGRLTGLAAFIATALHIKPVMSADRGVIIKLGQCRGLTKALKTMVDHVCHDVVDPENKILGITHINCPERAEFVRELLLEKKKFRDVFIVNGAGVSSTYACAGGIVVAV